MACQLRCEDYTVGWVCALPVELAAAQEMLDEEHADVERDPADNDENIYALGSIGGHNVAIVCLPAGRIGSNPAATVATQMRATFKRIRFGLMVGIGGGVPSTEADVRLGDVVVSQPCGKFAGVIQYDMGKPTPSGFERIGSLNTPPQILLAAVARVRANELRGRSKLSKYVSKLDGIAKFQRSNAGPDVLFEAGYKHQGGQACNQCSLDRHKARESRDSEEVVVHYGTIASGNQVMRSAAERDRVSTELGGVLCFEMEAAGLMNSFPCLVVRGICDYADSHKDKRWQPYAAAMAAAYAKEVLSVIPLAQVAASRTAEEAIRKASAKPAYCIPFLKNRHFVGRPNELAVLRKRLLVDQDCQKMSIVGLGGTGKTQVALQFAYEVKEAQPEWSILWVPALSMESFEQACTEIVHVLHIPQAADEKDGKELVKAWLSLGDAGRWLLVVDNADDADIFFGVGQRRGIFDYLPKSEQGIVIYTTRTMEVAVSLTQGDVLELGAMNWQDAREFLSNSLVCKALLRDTAITDTLLDELTCLPLAITQAAAYINRNRISILKYLQLLRSTDQGLISLMSREFRDDTRYKGSSNAVATTWMVSFSQIRKHDAVAAELLAFMSCIEWKAIPRSLLPSVHSETRMEEAVGTLCGYSFLARRGSDLPEANEERDGITGADSEEWFDMHRLVHLAMRIWIKKDGHAAEVVENAVRHVARVFPSDNHANLRVWQAYLPHALRLLEAEQDCDIKSKSELCFWVGRCLHADGRMREAMTLLEECHKLRSSLAKDDPDLLSAQHTLAVAYEGNGQAKKAVELLEVVVDVRNKVLKADDSNRLASQHALGTAYEADGQVKKAVGLLESVVKAKEMLNADNPSRLSSQHVLAMAYRADGQVKKAIELLEDIVEVRHKVLGADHPHRLASQHQLAAAYQADGQEKKAIELLESVVKTKTRILRTDHPSLLLSVEALADMRAKLAVQSDEAL